MLRLFAFLAVFSCCGAPAFSQRHDWRTEIDRLVELADSLSLVSQQTFHLNKFTREDRPVRETWHYTLHNGRVIIFEVHYFVDSLEFQEVYYLDRDRMVCMERYEILYPENDEDKILRGAVGFFDGTNLRQYVTMGIAYDHYNALPGYEVQQQFRGRYRELLSHRPLQEKNTKRLSSRYDRN